MRHISAALMARRRVPIAAVLTAPPPGPPPTQPPGSFLTPFGPLGPRNNYVPSTPDPAITRYVAPDATGAGNGTIGSPWTFVQACSAAQPGHHIWLRGGVYNFSANPIMPNGTAQSVITWESHPGEKAIFDGSNQPAQPRGGRWISVGGNSRVINIECRNTQQHGFLVDNRVNVTFRHCHGHHCHGVPFYGFTATDCIWEDNVLEYNADPGNNWDDADGVAIAFGTNNIVRNNILRGNSDDGLDMWRSTNCLIEYNVAIGNGYNALGQLYHTNAPVNGYKLGAWNMSEGGGHTVRFNLAYDNAGMGFMDNGTGSGALPMTFHDNTSYNNCHVQTWAREISFLGAVASVVRNNIAMSGPRSLPTSHFEVRPETVHSHNTWNLGLNTAAQIQWQNIIDPTNTAFLRLAVGSPAINAGTNMGQPFVGSAPDLGCYEHGA